MSGQGSGGNVLSAFASLIIPGLGQLLQGRLFAAIVHFTLALGLWIIFMGWIVHLYSVINAAKWEKKGKD
ncbi:MAG: hypothetical protein ISR95_08665 [Candidatus Marinimicrobia bacterium]|nr:hypothetical protein [Candidatus Brocadiales bacterium]MBL7047680.1 hypothetical protein [Candidatus Neomarinimicrobiota bacterium]